VLALFPTTNGADTKVFYIIAQILMILYAYVVAYKEATAVRMMRDNVPSPNPFNEPFHFYGYMMAIPTGIAITLLQWVEPSISVFILTPLVSMNIYWCVFDWKLNDEVWDKWNRVGESSKFDIQLRKLFKTNVEQKTVMLKVTLYVLLNTTYLLCG
jgi:hypothetical protein